MDPKLLSLENKKMKMQLIVYPPVWSRIWGHEAEYIQYCKILTSYIFQLNKLHIPQIFVSSL